ncbi:hypothetical protein GCM10009854_44010 [Saccharopolyspora halophila]|uniref:Ribulose 1,5-bisphosphate carboxylase large subunit n=1 Tax=Saccharopolyspora halophila TaxID=405551 RepID=A0ABN3GSQ1_9PSEU
MRVPNPADVVGMAKSAAGWAVGSATAVAAVPGRVFGMLDDVEAVISRVNGAVDRVEAIVERAEHAARGAESTVSQARAVADEAEVAVVDARRVAAEAAGVVGGARVVSDEASKTVATARRTADTADELLESYAPTAKRAAPLLERFVEEFSEDEVDAAIKLVDELPVLTEHIRTDVLPILHTLDRVGPEIHELLEVTYDVRRALIGIPGFQYFRRRGSNRVEEREQAVEEPGGS